MVKAIDRLTEYEVGDGAARGQKEADADGSVYRMDISGVDHPDARRIARVPELERIALAAEPAMSALVAIVRGDDSSDGMAGDIAQAALDALREAAQ